MQRIFQFVFLSHSGYLSLSDSLMNFKVTYYVTCLPLLNYFRLTGILRREKLKQLLFKKN